MAKRPPREDLGPTLLESAARRGAAGTVPSPLADRMRPERLEDVVGQRHLLGAGKLLARAIASDRVPSMILWGPPGSGKTTLARVVSHATKTVFVPFSAVLSGIPELREILAAARERRLYEGKRTTLFVDEIHRFNKAQQDAFLPHVEDGTITLIGATTENPSFSVNSAILSRAKVFRLEALPEEDVLVLLRRALEEPVRGLGARNFTATDDVLLAIARASSGDARRALSMLEATASLLSEGETEILPAHVDRAAEERSLLYDKSGDEHYDVTSALIKSMRGSDPDAAIYWLMRMIDAGDDPAFVLRRLVIFASEDVGNADPRGLLVAVAADQAFHRLGMPEGLYPIAHACLYLASCPKSNSVGNAYSAARALIAERGALPVPKKLRNAPTALMKEMGHGEGYKYAHEWGGYVPGETYLPDEIAGKKFYEPSGEGYEQTIRERLARLRSRG
ncbi:MAG TPA: replication-associated recombination protein A [Polyangiaceae bacterium]|nr:replication-associated recombination protein A [Polyangiaceae bacterium]